MVQLFCRCFKDKFTHKECLDPADTTEEIEVALAQYARIVDADEICMRADRKYVSSFAYKDGDYRNLCRELACETSLIIKTEKIKFWFITYSEETTFSGKWTNIRPLPGMQCGSGKSCNKGHCVKDKSIKQAWDAKCPFGDSPYLEGDIKTCKDVKKKEGQMQTQ
ncbi:hypothetical protein PoB_004275000 [Plakobranchus ocellatus]|uniref:Uncharacterized protein n=1 Tax=Plakobranchus ocellatus TaxID=259542 RepID=A0AAV4BAX5_9GAST|nr:hypothetical protein PoB_004275000 [Plakobranchus ocellatus]